MMPERFMRSLAKEHKEHPWASSKVIYRIAKDHARK